VDRSRLAVFRRNAKGHDALAHGETRPHIVTVEQPEMSKWTVILLLVHRPFFDFNQTMVGPLDFVQYFASARKIPGKAGENQWEKS
jgi:hypothetical protein